MPQRLQSRQEGCAQRNAHVQQGKGRTAAPCPQQQRTSKTACSKTRPGKAAQPPKQAAKQSARPQGELMTKARLRMKLLERQEAVSGAVRAGVSQAAETCRGWGFAQLRQHPSASPTVLTRLSRRP